MPVDTGRRAVARAGLISLAAALTDRARASGARAPSRQNLLQELPSPTAATPPAADLPETPPVQPQGASERLLPGFVSRDIRTSGADIHVLTKGEGRPLLLIHGHPETHVTWHKVAPALVEAGYSVVLPDLRGYGDSSKPGYSPLSRNYSFRAMAQDMLDVMTQLGHRTFMVAGHDRGGRVVHRMCLDHPDAILKAAVLDIAPTLTMYDDTTEEFATRYVWWSCKFNRHLCRSI